MNEMVIFILNEAMKDGNNRVKPVDEKGAPVIEDAHVVDLCTAINAPTIQYNNLIVYIRISKN